ncbi:protein-tyrosine-phosphatase [bacterium]|nr:protein-tyrosine-phosphatase [bacterium]
MSTAATDNARFNELYPALADTFAQLRESADLIAQDRRTLLEQTAAWIAEELAQRDTARLIFICTHNSRRSHMAQIWAQVAAWGYGLDGVQCFSGGTEATAFHPNAIAALVGCGFKEEAGENMQKLHISLRFSPSAPPLESWSKRYDDPSNPSGNFAAVMTCSDADEACPFIPGAAARFPIRYEDPKQSDGSGREAEVYRERCLEIGREMILVMKLVADAGGGRVKNGFD